MPTFYPNNMVELLNTIDNPALVQVRTEDITEQSLSHDLLERLSDVFFFIDLGNDREYVYLAANAEHLTMLALDGTFRSAKTIKTIPNTTFYPCAVHGVLRQLDRKKWFS